jgi:hypothetical protein
MGREPTSTATKLEDADQDTKIQVEESSDEDIIRFDTGGTERMTVASGGAVDVVGALTAGTVTSDAGVAGTTGIFSSDVTGLTLNATGDTSAGDNAAIGYTSAEGLILTGQGSTDDITIKNDADTTVVNVATGSSDVEISAGNLLFGTTSKGIYLGTTSAVAANHLQDYEEGVYDVTVTCSTSGSYGLNASYNSYSYTKIGRLVTIIGYVNVNSESSPNGSLRVSLPFTPLTLAEYQESGYFNLLVDGCADSDTDASPIGWIEAGNAYITLAQMTHGTGAAGGLDHTDVDTAFGITVNFSYLA